MKSKWIGSWSEEKWKSFRHVWLFDPTLQSMEFSRPVYWSGSHFLLQGIFPTQGSNPGPPHCRQIPYHLSHQGSLWDIDKELNLDYNGGQNVCWIWTELGANAVEDFASKSLAMNSWHLWDAHHSFTEAFSPPGKPCLCLSEFSSPYLTSTSCINISFTTLAHSSRSSAKLK